MPDDFENNMAQRMDSFRLNPDPQVWDQVAAALPPEKRRRRFAIWWWLLPAALCLGGGFWLMTYLKKNTAANNRKVADNKFASPNNSKPTVAIIPSDTFSNFIIEKSVSHKNTIPPKHPSALQKDTISKKDNAVEKPYSKEVTPQHLSVAYKRPAKKVSPRLSSSRVPFNYDSYTTSIPGASNTLVDAGDVADYNDKNVLIHSDKEVVLPLFNDGFAVQQPAVTEPPLVYAKASILMMPTISTTKPEVTKIDSPAMKETDTLIVALNEAKKPVVKTKSAKAVWSVVFAAGSSSLNGNISSDEKALSQSLNSGTYTGSAADLRRFTNPKYGFGFNVGISRLQTINKHWSWQAEINYQYLSSKQLVGSRNDSLTLSNSLSLNGFVAVTYNTRITTTQSMFANRVHRIQLSPQIIYILNPSAKSPFGLSVGMTVAYNLSNYILLHDYRSGSYIRSAQLSNNLLLGGTLAVDVFINKRIHAGLIFQHDFTNVAKAAVGSVFHWNQLQVKLGIPLSR